MVTRSLEVFYSSKLGGLRMNCVWFFYFDYIFSLHENFTFASWAFVLDLVLFERFAYVFYIMLLIAYFQKWKKTIELSVSSIKCFQEMKKYFVSCFQNNYNNATQNCYRKLFLKNSQNTMSNHSKLRTMTQTLFFFFFGEIITTFC